MGALSSADVADAQTAFGLDLLHALCAEKPGENLLISPTSAAEALGMLLPAGDEQSAPALGALLHLPAWSADLVAAKQAHTAALAALAYDGDPSSEDAPDFVNLSNRLWLSPGLEPEPTYLDDLATAYDVGVRAVDFGGDPQGATDEINRSVSDDTAGIIDPLFDGPLDPSTVAVLTNAVHLKARWATEFQEAIPRPFLTPTGSATVDMMHGGSGLVRSAGGWSAAELPYRDGTLAAVAVLPPEGTDPCSVDAGTLAALGAGDGWETDVVMPRLHLEQTHELFGPLAGLGLPTGGYPGLCGCDISRVVQKTYLDVDEKGTEAAAATGVVMEVSAPGVLELNRPFLLVLTDTETGSPLFFAVITDPSA